MGSALWDLGPGHRVNDRPVRTWQAILFCVLILGFWQVSGSIVTPMFLEVHGKDLPAWLRAAAEESRR
jgi:hypothetical protein